MKITHSTEKITPFGGFNFCHKLLCDTGIPTLIDNELGKRIKLFGFDYSDIFMNHLAIFLNGGDCTEDINLHLRDHLSTVRDFSVCSADTILRGIKELSTPLIEHTHSSGTTHFSSVNMKLNRLLLKALIKTGQLDRHNDNTLDYDNQVIATEKYDSKNTYKKFKGYQPGIATIGNAIVSVEGRNGNSQAKFQQKETLQRTFSLLNDQKVRIKRFRADSASYQKEVIELLQEQKSDFYIRAVKCANMEQLIGQIPAREWEKIRLDTQKMEVAQIDYSPFNEDKTYRLVVSRIKRKDQQRDLFSQQAYTYRSIITSDRLMTNKEVVFFYNQRGASERTFDVMNNDFGWKNLPCSFLNENTAYMIMTAMYANLYQFIIERFSSKLSWLKENFRLKKFIFRFINVAAKWIRTGRQYVLKLFTHKDYSPLAC